MVIGKFLLMRIQRKRLHSPLLWVYIISGKCHLDFQIAALFLPTHGQNIGWNPAQIAIAYIDDVIIFSKTFEEHLEHIETVFSRLREAGLKLKMSKCDFLKSEGQLSRPFSFGFWGQTGSSKKWKRYRNWPLPQLSKVFVRSLYVFVLSSFCATFCKNRETTNRTDQKNRRFFWDRRVSTSFETLRDALMKAPILAYPDIKKPYKVYTDASDYAIGAALVQETEMGERVIQYLSHQLNETQRRWPIIEKEAYAIVYSIQKFRHYLLGSKFTVMTDHKPLKHLFTSEMKNVRIQRWAIILEEFGCDVEYISGSKNVVADALSRLGPAGEDGNEEVMTGESSGDPANYASRIQGGASGQRIGCDDKTREVTCRANVIDSDRAPGVQLQSKVEECDEPDQMSKEKFREFLEDHPDFETLQARDEEIQRIVNILGDSGHSSHADIARYYVLEDGLLYRVTEPEKCGNHSGLQLVIPKFLQQPLIEEIHSGYFGGHLGIDKTYNKIRSRYYWSGMYRDVIEFLKNCVACNMRKLRRQRPPLQSMQIPQYPFEQIAIDTSGPFPESYEGNRYIINIIDMFSGWPEAFPTKSKSAETVAKILMEYIIPRHSCPRVIVSDNGTEFCNAVIDQINAFFNIKHITTSIYHPQANGKVERFNRVMSDALAKLVDRSQRDWDSKIPAILSAYRTAKNESTKFSPFYVIYGRDPVLPVDTLLAPKYRYQGEEICSDHAGKYAFSSSSGKTQFRTKS